MLSVMGLPLISSPILVAGSRVNCQWAGGIHRRALVLPRENGENAAHREGDRLMDNEEAAGTGGCLEAAVRVPSTQPAAGELLQSLIENLPAGVTLFDAGLRMIACNRLFRELLDFPDTLFADGLPSFERLLEFNLERGEYGDGPDAILRVAGIIDQARKPQPHVYERLRPNGAVLEIRGTPLPSGGFVTTYVDITERKRAEDEATRYATYLKTVLDSLPQGVSVFDENLELVLSNAAFRIVLDLPDSLARRGMPFGELLAFNANRGEYGDDGATDYVRRRTELALRFEPHRFERTRPNGRVVDVQGQPMRVGDRIVGFVTTYTDVTANKQAEQELRRLHTLFEEAIAYSPTYIWEVDGEGRFSFLKGSEKVLGYAPEELIGRRFGELRCRDVACREHRDRLDAAFRNREPYTHIVTCAMHKDGSHLWLSASAHPISDAKGCFAGYRGVGFDVTETTDIRKELERMALLDPLTGLANRRKFMDRFKLETERQSRHGQPLSLLVIDVDHFKNVNDAFGHLTGDMALRCVAEMLALAVRKIDLVARFGGEEFIVLLPETGGAGAATVAEKLRKAVEDLNIPIENRFEPLNITVSIGVATMTADRQLSFDDLMEMADQGLYLAKRAGRNRVVLQNEA